MGRPILDKVPSLTPERIAAGEIMGMEAQLNRMIRELPANCYVLANVETYDVGRPHKMPVITLSVCQER